MKIMELDLLNLKQKKLLNSLLIKVMSLPILSEIEMVK